MEESTHVKPRLAIRLSLTSRAATPVRRIIRTGVLVAIALAALHAISQAIDYKFLGLSRLFNADKRDSVFGVVSLLAQVAVGAVSLWRARITDHHRWAWCGLGVLVGALVPVRGLTTFNATALAIPLLCVFGLLCVLTWGDGRAARTVLWAGLVLLALSLLLHKVGLAADASTATDFTWAYQITGIVKHSAELAGWTLLATAIAAGLAGHEAPAGSPDQVLASSELESAPG